MLGVGAGRVQEGEDAQQAPRPVLALRPPHRQGPHPPPAPLLNLVLPLVVDLQKRGGRAGLIGGMKNGRLRRLEVKWEKGAA